MEEPLSSSPPSPASNEEKQMESDTKVFIGGLPPQTTHESLATCLSQYGQITESKVVMDITTGRSKGYGFVVFLTPQEAQTAVSEGFITVDGKECNCNLASVGAQKDASTKKRTFSDGNGNESYNTTFVDGTSNGYPAYTNVSYDKRPRTDLGMGYGMGTVAGAPGIDLAQQTFQNFQMHFNSSLQAMFTDIQSIKYEMTMMTQNLNSLKTTVMAVKSGVDALCARQGLGVTSGTVSFHQ